MPPENIENSWFSDVFRRYKKTAVAWKGLISKLGLVSALKVACKVSRFQGSKLFTGCLRNWSEQCLGVSALALHSKATANGYRLEPQSY